MRRFPGSRWWWILIALVAVGAPVAWYLGSPLFLSRVVDEAAVRDQGTVARGNFLGADDFHKGSGAAVVLAGTPPLLRFEEFQVTNGPDLYVYLAVHSQPRRREDVEQGFLSLGTLKGNIGAQNYEIPRGTDLTRYRSVVVYCQRFHVVFATATLQAAAQ